MLRLPGGCLQQGIPAELLLGRLRRGASVAGIGSGSGPNSAAGTVGTTVAEIYNATAPLGSRWSKVADSGIWRLYHSWAFLTRNATVSAPCPDVQKSPGLTTLKALGLRWHIMPALSVSNAVPCFRAKCLMTPSVLLGPPDPQSHGALPAAPAHMHAA